MPEERQQQETLEQRLRRVRRTYNQVWYASLSNLMGDANEWRGSESRHYRLERSIAEEHLAPLVYGSVLTVLLFAAFRVSNSNVSRAVSKLATNTASSKPLTSLPPSRPGEPTAWKSYLAKKQDAVDQQHGNLNTQLPFDMFLSLVCGLSIGGLLFRPTDLGHDVANAPLLQGKSLIYKHFCPSIKTAFAETMDSEIMSVEDESIQTFRAFVTNCRTRDEYLEQRRHRGANNSTVVPYPGLAPKR